MFIDFDRDIPIYEQIIRQIIQGIAQGELHPGDTLPSIRNLAEDIGVNLHTVNKAYKILREKGYVKMDKRKGAQIANTFPPFSETELKVRETDLTYWIADGLNRGLTQEKMVTLFKEMILTYKGDVNND